jgi:hypothetical protein
MKASHPLPKGMEEVSLQRHTAYFLLNTLNWKAAFPLLTHWGLEEGHYLLILKLKFPTCYKNLNK